MDCATSKCACSFGSRHPWQTCPERLVPNPVAGSGGSRRVCTSSELDMFNPYKILETLLVNVAVRLFAGVCIIILMVLLCFIKRIGLG